MPLVYLHAMTTANNSKEAAGSTAEVWAWTKFGNRYEVRCDGSICADYATQAEAEKHVARALHSIRERAAHKALVDHLFDASNWKLATAREVCDSLLSAYAYKNALAYFCGGAEIRQLPNGSFSVGSLGYYHYCGA